MPCFINIYSFRDQAAGRLGRTSLLTGWNSPCFELKKFECIDYIGRMQDRLKLLSKIKKTPPSLRF